jgi:Cu2+-exporting ATPase
LSSMHPVSRAMTEALSARLIEGNVGTGNDWADFTEVPGAGVQANLNGKKYRLGRLDFVQELHGHPCEIPSQLVGMTLSALGNADGWIALYALEDSLRDDAVEAIAALQKSNKHIIQPWRQT